VVRDRCELLCLDLPKAERLRASRPSEQEARTLAWIVDRAENLVSHHVRALRAAGLADYRRDGKMALYSLTDSGRALLEAVVGRAVSV
jgi:DNA-binding transcriptional ArsR family regulator